MDMSKAIGFFVDGRKYAQEMKEAMEQAGYSLLGAYDDEPYAATPGGISLPSEQQVALYEEMAALHTRFSDAWERLRDQLAGRNTQQDAVEAAMAEVQHVLADIELFTYRLDSPMRDRIEKPALTLKAGAQAVEVSHGDYNLSAFEETIRGLEL